MQTGYVRPARSMPERRLLQRRHQPDRRTHLRWYPHGGDRRYKLSRRKDDRWETLKAVLANLFPARHGPGSTTGKAEKGASSQ